MIVDHALARLASLPGTAPAHALPVYLPREFEILAKSIAVPVHGLKGRMTGLVSRAFSPRTFPGLVDGNALAMTRSAPLLPVCGLVGSSRNRLTAAGIVECARALDDCASVLLAVTRLAVTQVPLPVS